MKPIRIFVGFDYVESEAYHTFVHSVMERTSLPVSFTPIMRRTLPLQRPRDPLQSNEFAFTRWLVPYLSNYHGWSLFVDCDFLCRWDIADLWYQRNPKYVVQVCKHRWRGEDGEKFLGAKQTSYEKKCWSSLMLFNNERCTKLSPSYIEEAHGLDLHQFKWVDDDLIGEIDIEWNHLVDVYPHNPGARMVHFTKGGPYFHDYEDADYADEWWVMRNKAMYTKQRA